ncbi:MAG: hypothetical protein ISR96_06535 [Nitrospira sp.]|nr:hypothetical protein [bacterium]MBL7049151.1 hypothetical protein [Nitrospira sp.]
MIIFYRERQCSDCDFIEKKLLDLCLACRIMTIGVDNSVDTPTMLIDNRTITGCSKIIENLDSIETFKARWDKYQSDSCYCDEE